MEFPTLNPIPTTKRMVDVFRGYNHNLRIGSGEFYRMENLSSDLYPVLSPRGIRGLYANPASPQGLIAKEMLCYVDGADFLLGQQRIPMNLSTAHADCPKQLVSMGAYVLIFPDKKYINTANPEDHGPMEAEFTTEGESRFTLCNALGEDLIPQHTGAQSPENPENGAYWLDTSLSPPSLKQWSEAALMWTGIVSTYVKLTYPGIGAKFQAYDGVSITGTPGFDGSQVLQGVGEDWLILTGILTEATAVTAPITVSRKLPKMDFVMECGNRLWGCRYGMDEYGEPVNRIYASKLGDFRNWSCFMGIASDSYYVNLGSDGPFTGAVSHLGSPLFFKENMLHKIYGSVPSEFTLQDTPCRGVQPGCHESLAIVGEDLFYKSRSGICLYDGSLPRQISQALGSETYDSAAAGAHGSKYYISMRGAEGFQLFVYDAQKGQWHREDSFHGICFASLGSELYAIDGDNNRIVALLGSGEPLEEQVSWMAETGELGLSSPERLYISRITLRLALDVGAIMDVYAQYDHEDHWEHLASIRHCTLGSFSIPVRPRRSDYLRLKFQGRGGAKLYAMTKTMEKGSED